MCFPWEPLLRCGAGPAYTQQLACSNQAEPQPAEGTAGKYATRVLHSAKLSTSRGKAARAVGLSSSQSGPACGGIQPVTATWRLGWPTGGPGGAFGILCGRWHSPVRGEWRSDGVSMSPVSLLFHSALCCRTAWADWALAEVNEHDSHHLWGVGKSHVLHQLLFKALDFNFCFVFTLAQGQAHSVTCLEELGRVLLAWQIWWSQIICTSSIPSLGWLLSWEEKGLRGRKASGFGALLPFIP